MAGDYVVGVDVGTGSVRAALVSADGLVLKTAAQPIKTWSPQPGYYQQSSEDIWQSCCNVIKDVVKDVKPSAVKGIGFDATCSLVVLDEDERPVSVSPNPGDGPEQNVILWMDHRAIEEAEEVNASGHPVLCYVGGKISLEMQVPKLMWLKRRLPAAWARAAAFYDLPDFLTWKATGSTSRSLCSLVCKWTYEVDEDGVKGWNQDFFQQVNLLDLLEDGCRKIGSTVLEPGSPCGRGLSAAVARETALSTGTPVAASIIDAHAGGLGLVGCSVPGVPTDFCSRLALICGTSTCHMALGARAVAVSGAWGPYRSAMVPGLWLTEAGQSAAGRLIDHTIDSHPAAAVARKHAGAANRHVTIYLADLLERMAAERSLDCIDKLTSELHVWPDHHGNRSPLADPTLKGMVCGLTLASDERDLALIYLATLQALAYGTRHIVERLESSGLGPMRCLLACGGLSRDRLFVTAHANTTRRPVAVPQRTEAVLGGAAVLGAVAGGLYGSVTEALKAMAGLADIVTPDDKAVSYHEKKYKVFLRMVSDQLAYREIMK